MMDKKSTNIFLKEWNGIEFSLSIPTKITNANKPFIYFYFPDSSKGDKLVRIRKGGVGGVKDSPNKVKKLAPVVIDNIINQLQKGWNPVTDEYVVIKDELTYNTTVNECCKAWIRHREERHQNKMIGNTAIKNNKIAINHFTDWLKLNNYLNRKISTITVIDIDNFLGYKSNKLNWNKVTYNTYRTDINTFFNYLKKLKVIIENPVTESEKKNTKRDSSRFKIYEENELTTVLNLLMNNKRYYGLYVAAKLLYSYNIRPIELTKIQVRDIDFEKGLLTIPVQKTKNENEAVFGLDDDSTSLLKDLIKDAPPEYFIFGHRCKPSEIQNNEQYFGQKFRQFRAKNELPKHLKFYALKHSSNHYDLEDGASFHSIMEKNRHSSLAVTNLYIKQRLNKKVIKPTENKRF